MAVGVLTNVKFDEITGTMTAIFTADGTPSASSVFCGFKPRKIKMTQVSGTVGNGAQTSWQDGMTSAYYIQQVAAGTTTIVTSNGFTPLDGSEASPAAAATGSPASSGPGFTIGTGPQPTASAAYALEVTR